MKFFEWRAWATIGKNSVAKSAKGTFPARPTLRPAAITRDSNWGWVMRQCQPSIWTKSEVTATLFHHLVSNVESCIKKSGATERGYSVGSGRFKRDENCIPGVSEQKAVWQAATLGLSRIRRQVLPTGPTLFLSMAFWYFRQYSRGTTPKFTMWTLNSILSSKKLPPLKAIYFSTCFSLAFKNHVSPNAHREKKHSILGKMFIQRFSFTIVSSFNAALEYSNCFLNVKIQPDDLS